MQLGVVDQIHSLLLRPLSGNSCVVPSLAIPDVLTDRPTHHGHNTASIECLQTGFYLELPHPETARPRRICGGEVPRDARKKAIALLV